MFRKSIACLTGLCIVLAVMLVLSSGGCLPEQVASTPPPGDVDGSNGSTGDSTGDSTGGDSTDGDTSIRGTLAIGTVAAGAASPIESVVGCEIVAVSDATGEAYRGTVGEDGGFEVELPASEAGNTFVLTLLGSDSRPVGPVLLAVADGTGFTGLKPAADVDLGTIEVIAGAPLLAGNDADVDEDEIDDEGTTRLGNGNLPVGVGNNGKGEGSRLGAGEGLLGNGLDRDRDGLVNLFDADDDGDGTVDDFEDGAEAWEVAGTSDVRANFFMNLKVDVANSDVYYNGTQAEIDADLSIRTVVTFEVMTEASSTRTITGASLLSSPAPSYLPTMTLFNNATPGQLWSDTGYAFLENSDRYEAFAIPNAVMNAGDTFTVQIVLDDGTVIRTSRMLNYIFKRIPRLINHGTSSALVAFDPTSTTENGTSSAPILVDATQDFVAEFAPPEDEDGSLLTDLDYVLEFFFYDASGSQINSSIDSSATWSTPVTGTETGSTYGFSRMNIANTDLTLTASNTYLITVPKEMFIQQATLTDGTTTTVSQFKIDIAAQCPSGNAALMFNLARK